MSDECRPLIEILAEVPDFRKKRGKRYSLASILALTCAAMLCGYKSYGAIAEWSQHYGGELASALGFKDGKTPSVGTLHTIFRHLDKTALETKLNEWAETVLSQTPRPKGGQAIAIDGKTLRGSAKAGALDVHLLSVLSHGLGLTLYQKEVDAKTNEITAVQQVLSDIILQGRIVTVDALLTQKQIAQSICEKGGTS